MPRTLATREAVAMRNATGHVSNRLGSTHHILTYWLMFLALAMYMQSGLRVL